MRGTNSKSGRVLIIEADRAIAGLYADVIATHCRGMRIDVCGPREHEVLHDNVGGADVVVCSCGGGAGNRFDVLREVLSLRACAAVLVLVPADMPGLADQAMDAGAADVLLRAPGYLEQLPVAVRATAARSRAAMAPAARANGMRRELVQIRHEVVSLRTELDELLHRSPMADDGATGRLLLPVITRKHGLAKAA